MMATCLQFALSNPMDGCDTEFNRWYSADHLPHGVQVPGILAGQRFRRENVTPWPPGTHQYLVIWEMDNPAEVIPALIEAKFGALMPISAAINMATVQPPTMWLRAGVRNKARIANDTRSRGPLIIAFLNSDPDQAAAFERGIMSETLELLADRSGVISADFFTLADEQIRNNARKYRYSIVIELSDVKSAIESLTKPVDQLLAITHLDNSRFFAALFTPIGIRLAAPTL